MSKRAKISSRNRSHSQRDPGRSQRSFDEDTEEHDTHTVQIDEFVTRFVRYMLIKSSSNSIITDSDIKKNVLNKPGAPNLKQVIQKSRKVLNEVYGFNLQESFTTKTQYYYLQVAIKNFELEDEEEEFSVPEDTNRIMLMLLLLHIFMTNNNCSEESLLQFMEKFPSEHFSNLTDFLKNSVKQKYLESFNENNKLKYKWGPKAECTVSKMDMLEFMANLYEKPSNKWPLALEAAEDQEKNMNDDEDENTSDESD